MSESENTVVWRPSPEAARRTAMSRFAETAGVEVGTGIAGYRRLWQWSVSDLPGFWAAVWRYYGLERYGTPETVLAEEKMPGARWFPGIRLNIADYILSRGEPGDLAVTGVTETGERTTLTRAQLRDQVAGLARSLRDLGVRRGDRVVGYLPNVPEAVVAFLAAASIGAVWSSVGQDYSAQAVIDRIGQLEPVVLITATGYHYGGRGHSRREEIEQIRSGIPSLRHTIVVVRDGGDPADGHLDWRDLVRRDAEPKHEMVDFDHPLWVLFSSGTTGLPKGIVHGHGGILLEQLKFLGLHTDLGPRDRFFWYTSPSWVMWNIQACALATGAGIVCYDGSPTYPGPARLWEIVADQGVTVFGSSPGFLEASRKAGVRPSADFDLRALRILSSSGSPIAPITHEWAVSATGGLPLFSISGGTDIASAFCGGSPTVEIRCGEIPVRCLGVAMDAWDERSRSVHNGLGELVVVRPMPSMPVHFWNDETQERYREAYFSIYPGVWRHGDWITITDQDSVVVHGRSDSTLNRNGVRMGSADIYHALEAVPEIADALVLGVEEGAEKYWMPLFVVLTPHAQLDERLRARIVDEIKRSASPRHVPDEIIPVPGLPHTRTGKRLEVPIKRLFQGGEAAQHIQAAAIDAPELLEPFIRLAAERRARNQA